MVRHSPEVALRTTPNRTARAPRHRRHWRSFAAACRFAATLELASRAVWHRYCRGQLPDRPPLPANIPAAPERVYRDRGWKSWGHWLGTGTVATGSRQFRPFEDARDFVRALGLRNQREWRAYSAGRQPGKGLRPEDIPGTPERIYPQWLSLGDWLGTGTVAPQCRQYRPFAAARRFARRLRLKNQDEWFAYARGQIPGKGMLPADIPAAPHGAYREWHGYADWLGTGNTPFSRKHFLSFAAARRHVRALGLRSQAQWAAYCAGRLPKKGRRPEDIPALPQRVYRDRGWTDLGDWLGTGTTATQGRRYRPYGEARKFTRSLGLSTAEWRRYAAGRMPEKGTRPTDIPAAPHKVYRRRGWKGYSDWLGRLPRGAARRSRPLP